MTISEGWHLTAQGFYSIVVDDGPEQWFDGFLNVDQPQGVLYTSSGLSVGQHKVVRPPSHRVCAVSDYVYRSSTTGLAQRTSSVGSYRRDR